MIHPSEMKDFEAAIVQGGFDVTDFDARQLLHLPGTKEGTDKLFIQAVRTPWNDLIKVL